jgi:sugar-specific transcriptional regulator TrmB
MKEDLVRKLSDFGFTVNQAKVYLSIVQSGPTIVSAISESTQLHRQDIYKILPKLEKMGLIMKTIDKPVIIEAIPMKNALRHLVSTEREKANERISRLEANLKELLNAIREQQERRETLEEEERFVLLKTDDRIKNIADLTFENTKKECDFVTNLELMTRRTHHFREHFQKLSRRGARIRVIVENINNEDLVKRTIEEIRPDKGDFAAKLIYKKTALPYRIIDNKELFIRRKATTESGLSWVLWTNSRSIVQFYKENFEEAWNDPRAVSICPERDLANRESAKAQQAA